MMPTIPIFLEDFLWSYTDILVALYKFVSFLSIDIAFLNADNFSVSCSFVKIGLLICKPSTLTVEGEWAVTVDLVVTSGITVDLLIEVGGQIVTVVSGEHSESWNTYND